MTAPHLWPARPEYLRVGTRVEPGPDGPSPVDDPDGALGVIIAGPGQYGFLVFWAHVEEIDWVKEPLMIDLRDVTARAHAAMAYTRTDTMIAPGPRWGNPQHVRVVLVTIEGPSLPELLVLRGTLARMRAMDESVTVHEARAALAWAEQSAGVTP